MAQPEATKEMCAYCFEVLERQFTSGERATHSIEQRFRNARCPLFVTWNIHSDAALAARVAAAGGARGSTKKEGRLRGCIGTLSPTELATGLREYALISSLRDRRFDPVSEQELPRLSVTVSLLTNYEDARDVYDWEVGVHGIILDFRCDAAGARMSISMCTSESSKARGHPSVARRFACSSPE